MPKVTLEALEDKIDGLAQIFYHVANSSEIQEEDKTIFNFAEKTLVSIKEDLVTIQEQELQDKK